MKIQLIALVSVALTACPRPSAVAHPARDASLPGDDCTLSTPLTPGVPGSPGHLIASERNPNGASELATLMRRFVDDVTDAKALLKAGAAAVPARLPVHRKIRCAWPTDAADRNQTFDALAVNYLSKVQAFDGKPSRETYEGVLDGCKACHEVSCGGPLELIEGLRWK